MLGQYDARFSYYIISNAGMLILESQVQSPSVNGMDQVGSEFWTSPSLNIAVTPQEKLEEVGCWKKIHPFDS